MSQVLNSKTYDVSYDGLIANAKHPVDVRVIGIKTEKGFKRGDVLSYVPATTGSSPTEEKYGLYGATDVESGSAMYIVADDVKGEATGEVAVTVYISGCFNINKLTVDESASVDAKAVEDLRSKGIFVQ